MREDRFVFNSVILKQPKGYTALCLDLDVASEGKTSAVAKQALYEAVTLYLETAFENNLPYLRPVPSDEDPRLISPRNIVSSFNLRVDFKVEAHA